MTPPLYTTLESQVLVALERCARASSIAGWVGVETILRVLPQKPEPREFDAVVRRLIRNDRVQILMDGYPPSAAPFQALRRIDAP